MVVGALLVFGAMTAGVLAAKGCSLAVRLFGPPRVTLQEAYGSDGGVATFDHTLYDDLVRAHVDEAGRVDYEGLARESDKLGRYLAALAGASLEALGRDEKLALLINAYNAFTLRLVLDHYPLESIRDIPADERWKGRTWEVGGHSWTLEEIEHEQIRPKFREPRVHFALVCASVGCPPLRDEAFTSDGLESQLEEQARHVHERPRWLRFEPGRGVVHLTRLYQWYADDFAQAAGSPVRFAARYAPPLASWIEAHGTEPDVRWLEYDWKLNGKGTSGNDKTE